MASLQENDTIPVPCSTQELFVDNSADEDFIPTSQPKRIKRPVRTKNSKTISKQIYKGVKDIKSTANTGTPLSLIENTNPGNYKIYQSVKKDISGNFIPKTETKAKVKFHSVDEPGCEKKFSAVDSFVKCREDLFRRQPNFFSVTKLPHQIKKDSKTQTSKFIVKSPANADSSENQSQHCGTTFCSDTQKTESILARTKRIIVNETIDLSNSENLSVEELPKISKANTENTKMSYFLDCDLERHKEEDSHIFENSYPLLQSHPEFLLSCAKFENNDKQMSVTSEKFYLDQTNDSNKPLTEFQGKESVSNLESSLPIVPECSKEGKMEDNINDSCILINSQNCNLPSNSSEKFNPNSLEIKTMTFKFLVNCLVVTNKKTQKIHHKCILNVVNDSKANATNRFELESDSVSDKSKRYSTSSSGSVYSDKTALPFCLPMGVSPFSDFSVSPDSLEDNLVTRSMEKEKESGRIPWRNEFLIPLKMDELVASSLVKQKSTSKYSTVKAERDCANPVDVLEKSYTEQNLVNSEGLEKESDFTYLVRESTDESPHLFIEPIEIVNEESTKDDIARIQPANNQPWEKEPLKNESTNGPTNNETMKDESPKDEIIEITPEKNQSTKENYCEVDVYTAPIITLDEIQECKEKLKEFPEHTESNNSEITFKLSEGLPVFARWTDRRYYSGIVLRNSNKSRWDIEFDDGATKQLREDFIIPHQWLKVGELVFALVDNTYSSGQIVDIDYKGNEATYAVVLDNANEKVTVPASDLCLTEVMADLVKEKYRYLISFPTENDSPRINFDVLTGKQPQDQKTPLRRAKTNHAKKLNKGKKSSCKVNYCNERLGSTKQKPTPKNTFRRKKVVRSKLKKEINSLDTISGQEGGPTPLRGVVKRMGQKSKRKVLNDSECKQFGKKFITSEDLCSCNNSKRPRLKRKQPKFLSEEDEKETGDLELNGELSDTPRRPLSKKPRVSFKRKNVPDFDLVEHSKMNSSQITPVSSKKICKKSKFVRCKPNRQKCSCGNKKNSFLMKSCWTIQSQKTTGRSSVKNLKKKKMSRKNCGKTKRRGQIGSANSVGTLTRREKCVRNNNPKSKTKRA